MRPVLLRLLTVGLVLVGLARPVSAAPRRAEIKDEAKLFSPSAVTWAKQRLEEISAKYDLDIVIETVKSLSPEERGELSRTGTNLRKNARALSDMAQRRAEQMVPPLDGLFIVYYKVPRDVLTLFEGEHFQVTVVLSPEARSATLSPRDCEYIRQRFAGPRGLDWRFRRKTEAPDEVLRGGVEEIGEVLQRTANRGLVDYFTVPVLVLSFLGVWVLLLCVRARVCSGTEPDASIQRPALLGALFGTVSAFWVYDKLFRASVPPSNEAEAPEPLFGSEPAPAAPEPPLREGEEPHEHAYDANHPGAPVS